MYKIVDRPGYFGKNREQIIQGYNEVYGKHQWKEMWVKDEVLLCFEDAVKVYDRAYKEFIYRLPVYTLQWICNFDEVYDNCPSNIMDYMTHNPDAVPRHLQDVSIRKVIFNMGLMFKGWVRTAKDYMHTKSLKNYLVVRGPDTNGNFMNPGNVCCREFISPEGAHLKPWWAQEGSIEHWWQANKVIVT